MSPTGRASTVPALRAAIEAGGPQPTGEEAKAEETLPPRPPKPIRFTLDLDREQHRFLKTFAVYAEVDAAKVMRVLLDELRDNPTLAERVRAMVHRK